MLEPSGPKDKGFYDKKFTKKIRKLRPEWFDEKPSLLSVLKKFITKVMGPKDKGFYDKKFTKKIRKLRPEWFK